MTLEPQLQRFTTTTCNLHPEENVTGFCASCLRERLQGLDPATRRGKTTTTNPSSSSTAASALKAIFKGSSAAADNNTLSNHRSKPSYSSSSSSFFSELRRSKSFSGGKGEGFSGVFEPQRKSCDVRVRSTLWSLFNLDDEGKSDNNNNKEASVEIETRNLGFSGVGGPVEEEEEEEEEENDDEIRVSDEPTIPNVNPVVVLDERVPEIEEEEEELEQQEQELEEEQLVEEEVKTMKDHIDLDAQSKKPAGRDLKEIAGSFWLAASVFSKKLQKWRRKQKMKKRGGDDGGGSTTMRAGEKPTGRHYRETQSEIADYGFGRRSCDTDPRFSLDAGRMSFDDPRYSWDEPRASWDGYLIGRTTTLPRLPPMLSVVEDAPPPPPPALPPVRRYDNLIPVEEQPRSSTVAVNEDDNNNNININININIPGGSAQTRDYYSDSSSSQQRRRKSFERSTSIKKVEAAEVDESKSVSNAKVSPAATIDCVHGTKLNVPTDRDFNLKSISNSLRDDCSESFESSAFRDAAASVVGGGGLDRKNSKKSSSRWSKAWNIWALIHRRNGGSKDEEDERYCRGNVVGRSFSESWQELRRDANGDARGGGFNRNVFRSNSSVSSRSSFLRRSGRESSNGHDNKKRRDDFVLERNRSARYSPNNLDNGLLRFYLTPLRTSRRNGSGKNGSKNSHSIARSVLRLY